MPALTLTDALLRAAAPSKKLTELWDLKTAGLCLRISPTGVRTWTFRYRPKDSVSFKRLGLGRYPEVGLALARARAQEKRVDVAGGADPQGDRKAKRAASALTFNALADSYLDRYAKPHKRSWKNDALYLKAHVRPAWGERPANRITRADAATLLDGIAKAAPTSANRTQSILSRAFNWAIESGLVEVNPLARMPKRAKEKAKDRTLAPDEIRTLWRALDGDGSSIPAALRLLMLTGLRPGEVAGLEIGEVADIDYAARARLEIPGARMKSGRPHVVPLAPMALAIVRAQLDQTFEVRHLFPSAYEGRGPIARHSLSQGLRRIIEALPAGEIKSPCPTPHDFRRTVATGLAALGVPREDRLAVLAHTQGDVHGIHYDKHDRFAEKRRALEAWENHLADIVRLAPAKADNVVKLTHARR